MIIYNFWYDNADYDEWRKVYNDYYESLDEAKKAYFDFELSPGQKKGLDAVDISVHPNKVVDYIFFQCNEDDTAKNMILEQDYDEYVEQPEDIELLSKLKQEIENNK